MNGNRNGYAWYILQLHDDAATGDRGEAAKKVMVEMAVGMLLV